VVRTRTRTGRLARHFPMHALRLRRAPARRLAFPASSVPCIRQGPAQQDEQAPTCAPGPAPPTRPDFPASAAPAAASPVPGTTTTTTPSVRKSLKITVPRAPPRTPLPLDVADIFDDIDAWSIFVPSSGPRSTDPSTSTSSTSIGAELSPPRIPETPMSAYSAYDPVELIIDYATQPSPLLSSFLPEYDSDGDKDDDDESWPTEEKLRSRWSCSTIGTLAAGANAKTPTSPSASEKLRFHLGSVARRVRACRAGGDAAVPKTHARSSSEPIATPGADGDGVVWVCSRSRATKNPTRRAVCGANRSRSSFSCGRLSC
jgi:hypothetical protein